MATKRTYQPKIRRRLLRPQPPRPNSVHLGRSWLDAFVAYATGECHLSENTVAAYQRRLEELEGDVFNMDRLMELGVVKKPGEGLRILGSGELTRKIMVEAHHFSKSAVEKIEKAGGVAQVVGAAAE